MDVAEQVERAIRNYEHLPSVALREGIAPQDVYLASPNRLAYALGWIVASSIVGARYRDAAVDAIPVFHPEHGWDRFLLTRRLSCRLLANERANRFGMLLLDGEDAPRLTAPSGTTRIALATLLREEPEAAIARVDELVPRQELPSGKHAGCIHQRAPRYPLYFNAVAELIAEHPGLVAAREIYVDDREVEGQYHPLYLHGVTLQPLDPSDRHGMPTAGPVHDWFQLQLGDLFAFFDIYGSRAIYRTERGTWSRVRKSLNDTPEEAVKDRIAGWMRLNGRTPDPEID